MFIFSSLQNSLVWKKVYTLKKLDTKKSGHYIINFFFISSGLDASLKKLKRRKTKKQKKNKFSN